MLLALFPLQLVIFPGEEIPLHIFEPRYKQLIVECRDEGIHFGIPAYWNDQLAQYGTEVELVSILKTYDNGEMDIIVRGKRVFVLQEYVADVPDKLYSAGNVAWVETDDTFEPKVRDELVEKFRHALRLAEKDFDLGEPLPENLSYRIAPLLGMTIGQKLELLAEPRESERQKILIGHLDKVIRNLQESSDKIRLGQAPGLLRKYFSQN